MRKVLGYTHVYKRACNAIIGQLLAGGYSPFISYCMQIFNFFWGGWNWQKSFFPKKRPILLYIYTIDVLKHVKYHIQKNIHYSIILVIYKQHKIGNNLNVHWQGNGEINIGTSIKQNNVQKLKRMRSPIHTDMEQSSRVMLGGEGV